MLTLDKFEEASEIVSKVTQPTKLVYSEYLSAMTGNKVYLKPENMQMTGAYKIRGAYYKISTLSDEERAKGLITASAGNHAQGVAYAARIIRCQGYNRYAYKHTFYQSKQNKTAMVQMLYFTEMFMMKPAHHAYELADKNGYTFIHPFDDLTVATGQGTIAMEIVKELPYS